MTSPDPEYWDTVADQDDQLPGGWRRHARAAHLALIQRWRGPLSGRWLKTDLQEELSPDRALLPHLSASWTGIDISPQVCASAALANIAATVADVRSLPFGDDTFDGVLSTSTLDHFDTLDDLHRSLAEIQRILRPGGALVLTLDNPANPLISLRNRLPRAAQRRTGLVPFEVGCTLGASDGSRALAEAGFTVDAIDHLLHAPHVIGTRLATLPWWERRALPSIDRLARTRLAHRSGHYVAFLARAGRGDHRSGS